MGAAAGTESKLQRRSCMDSCGLIFLILFAVFVLLAVVLRPITPGVKKARESSAVQTCRSIGLAMFEYANDNDGKYPDGNSSTEVFQKLIDGQYISDPAIFYDEGIPGKTKPGATAKLNPENVCWDVTSGVTANSPDGLPVVFLTGYKVTYAPGAAAVLLKQEPRTWRDWAFGGEDSGPVNGNGIAVTYKSNSSFFKVISPTGEPNSPGSIPNFVSPDYKPDGKTYRQLTPDGVLP
jgi:type II secretory pathway pseudopilin PulG